MISQMLRRTSVSGIISRWLNETLKLLVDNRYFVLAGKIESFLSKHSRDPRHVSSKNTYMQLARIHKQFGNNREQTALEYPVYFINWNNARLPNFDKRAKRLGINYIKIQAYDALSPSFDFKQYAPLIAETFWGGGTSIKKGVIGCYLSHAEVWKIICDEGIDHAIILEDDAFPLVAFPHQIDSFHLPADYDVVLINCRTAAWLDADSRSLSGAEQMWHFYPYHYLIEQLYAHAGTIMTTGTESYIVSRKGAEKLTTILYSSKICVSDDWAMTLHSMSPGFRDDILSKIREEDQKGIAALRISDVLLETYVMLPGLVGHRDFNKSNIDHNNLAKRIESAEIHG